MVLPRARLLQIGDVHLPSAAKAARSVDLKDRAFSIELRNTISRQPIKTVFKKIHHLLEKSSLSGIFFMGDMTDFGDIDGYKSGINYITSALQLGAGRLYSEVFTGIVPGNHDINRELAKLPSMTAKFGPLNAAVHEAGLGRLPIERSISKELGPAGAKCLTIFMNSCWGCGALEYIPEEFRRTVGVAIEQAIAKGDEEVLKTYYNRQFDTPAFSDVSVANLVSDASELSPDHLLIVVAHHNLLPQRLTRLAPYTELVNSGAVRSSLMEAKRPILYLHGHIHTTPIEIMSTPGGDVLVSISAPTAEAGFNILEIVFTRAGAPLVAHVLPWTFDQSGVLRQGDRQTIPLIGRRRRSLDESLPKVYSYLLTAKQCYWADLVKNCDSFFASDSQERLQECIELLIADQSVMVENYESRPESWILEAKI